MAIKIARYLAAPSARQPIRYGGGPRNKKTVLATPMEIRHVNMALGAVAGVLPATDFMAFLFRNPLRNIVLLDTNNTPDQSTTALWYDIYGRPREENAATAMANTGVPTITWTENYTADDYDERWIWFVYAASQPTKKWQPHGPVLYAGMGGNEPESRGFPLETGMQVIITMNAATTANTGHVNFKFFRQFEDSWVKEDEISVNCNTVDGISNRTATFTCVRPGEYAVKRFLQQYNNVISITYSGRIINNTALSCWAHRASPDMNMNLGSVNGPRVPAADVIISNTGQELYREGWIRGCDMPVDSHWREFITSVSDAFNELADQATKAGPKGIHGSLRPDDTRSYEPRIFYRTNHLGQIVDSFYPLENFESFVMFGGTMQDTNSRSFEYRLTSGFEYQTLDSWRNAQYPTSTAMDWQMAEAELKKIPQFNSNETHMNVIDRILGYVRQGKDFVKNAIGVAEAFGV